MVRSLFGNSNRKLRNMFWGNPFIPVGMNQTECCLPFTISRFLLSFRLTLHKFAFFMDSTRNGCGNSGINWKIASHYAIDTPTGVFCQMVSIPSSLFDGVGTCIFVLFLCKNTACAYSVRQNQYHSDYCYREGLEIVMEDSSWYILARHYSGLDSIILLEFLSLIFRIVLQKMEAFLQSPSKDKETRQWL